MKIKVIQKPNIVKAASLDDAYKKGYFSGSMNTYEFMDRVTKYNPQLRWYSNETHRGLFDTNLHEDHSFICGIGKISTIPQFTIEKFDPEDEKKITYTDAHGDETGSEKVYTEDDEGYIFARSWRTILKIIKKRGYKFDEKGLN